MAEGARLLRGSPPRGKLLRRYKICVKTDCEAEEILKEKKEDSTMGSLP